MRRCAAIIGGGVIGGGWAARFLLSGWDVAIFDPAPDAARKIDEVLANARHSFPSLYDTEPPKEGHLRYSESIEDAVMNAHWVQESVPEKLSLKQKIYQAIQSANDQVMIGSSTSGFKPSDLRAEAIRPDRIIVAHPFNPVYLLPLVEIVAPEGAVPAEIEEIQKMFSGLGMYPLVVRKEIDAHVADRLLEAVWREALWLIRDEVATTEEIDNAMRYGFGLRWAQMGLFETYRIAGGEAGMKHFIGQFGPALQWPWTKLMDVPELDDDLIARISDQSDAQSGKYDIRALERIRDENLVGILRALKKTNWGAGAILNSQEQRAAPALHGADWVVTARRRVPLDWLDYNGHVNEAAYLEGFSRACDCLLDLIGAGQAYVDAGASFFTRDNHLRYFHELTAGEAFHIRTLVVEGHGKKLHLFHEMYNESQELIAICEQFLLHVNLKTRQTCAMADEVLERLAILHEGHAKLPRPEHLGAAIKQTRM